MRGEAEGKGEILPSMRGSSYQVIREEFSVSADNLIEKVKELLHEGNVTRITVKDEKGNIILKKGELKSL